MADVSLFWETNIAAVTSCENSIYHVNDNFSIFCKEFHNAVETFSTKIIEQDLFGHTVNNW